MKLIRLNLPWFSNMLSREVFTRTFFRYVQVSTILKNGCRVENDPLKDRPYMIKES